MDSDNVKFKKCERYICADGHAEYVYGWTDGTFFYWQPPDEGWPGCPVGWNICLMNGYHLHWDVTRKEARRMVLKLMDENHFSAEQLKQGYERCEEVLQRHYRWLAEEKCPSEEGEDE